MNKAVLKLLLETKSAQIKSLSPKFHLGQIVQDFSENRGVVTSVEVTQDLTGKIAGFTYLVAFPESDLEEKGFYWPEEESFVEEDLEAVEVTA